jgi:ABC-type transporter Mla subunit MlaD
MRILFVLALIVSISPAFAQNTSKAIDRISASLGACVGALEQRSDQLVDLKLQVEAKTKEIDDLKKPKETSGK